MSQKVIKLNQFKPRPYQDRLVQAFEEGRIKRFVAIWPRRCLSGESHITMADGSFKLLRDIKVGDEILSWENISGEFVPSKVTGHWKTEIKKTKKVKSFGSLTLVSSNDHVFANTVHSSDQIKWTPLKDLGRNRKLMQYAGIDDSIYIDDSISDSLLAEFLGLMMGDGYCSGDQQPKFTNSNPEVIERMELLVSSLFNVQINKVENGNCIDLRFSNGTLGGGAYRNDIKDFFKNNGINIQKSLRCLPSFVWKFSHDSIYRFFAGLIAADGNIYIHKNGFINEMRRRTVPPAVEVTISCGMSDLYAWDIYWLLRKVGIFPQVPYKEKGSNWKIKIAKCLDLKKMLNIPIPGKNENRLLALNLIKDRYRQASTFKSCIRTSYAIQDSEDEELYDIEVDVFHCFIANGYLVHNSGKDICALNLLLRSALRRIGTYFYVFPTFSMGRRIIWDAIDIDGRRIIDHYIPEDLVESRNEQQMRIRLINGSQIQILGSDDVDKSLVGTNAVGIVFSEYALQDPHAWQLSIPILKASNGWALFVSTVRGRNHFYDLYEVVKDRDDWFCELLTVEDTQHITVAEIEKEIESGQISRDLAMQEFWNDFNLGVEGSFYGKYIDELRKKNQITDVMWEPYLSVHTALDLGYNDLFIIIWFQCTRDGQIRIIDYYENNKQGLEHYAKIIKDKPYTYGKHIAPHDIAVHDLSTGVSRWKMLHDLGITCLRQEGKLPSIDDGIEAVRRILPKCWFDKVKCEKLIKYLENYRQEYDNKRKVYKSQPLHDINSHAADAMRYLALGLSKVQAGSSSPEELDKRYKEAVFGSNYIDNGFFSNDKGY